MQAAEILAPDDSTKRLLPCPLPFCSGFIEHVTVSTALALAEYLGATKGAPEIRSRCSRCGIENAYTYDEVLSLLPHDRRPRQLPQGFTLALALAMLRARRSATESSTLVSGCSLSLARRKVVSG